MITDNTFEVINALSKGLENLYFIPQKWDENLRKYTSGSKFRDFFWSIQLALHILTYISAFWIYFVYCFDKNLSLSKIIFIIGILSFILYTLTCQIFTFLLARDFFVFWNQFIKTCKILDQKLNIEHSQESSAPDGLEILDPKSIKIFFKYSMIVLIPAAYFRKIPPNIPNLLVGQDVQFSVFSKFLIAFVEAYYIYCGLILTSYFNAKGMILLNSVHLILKETSEYLNKMKKINHCPVMFIKRKRRIRNIYMALQCCVRTIGYLLNNLTPAGVILMGIQLISGVYSLVRLYDEIAPSYLLVLISGVIGIFITFSWLFNIIWKINCKSIEILKLYSMITLAGTEGIEKYWIRSNQEIRVVCGSFGYFNRNICLIGFYYLVEALIQALITF